MTDALCVALVSADWSAQTSGGATFELEVRLAALDAAAARPLVVYPATARSTQYVQEHAANARITLLPVLRDPWLPGRIARRLSRMVRRAPAPLPFAELSSTLRAAGADCAWLLGGSIVPLDLPYVATVWDLQHRVQPWFPEVSGNGEWRERERLFSEFIARAAAVVVGTAAGAGEIRAAYGEPPGGIHVIPMPTPAFALDAALEEMPPRPEGLPARYLFYPAQFWAHKNHVTAVRVLAALGDWPEAPDLVLVGADRGTHDHAMQAARALGVERRVHSLGFVTRATLVALYRHAEALLFPSLFGPDNLPPLEAMALGCPVIAARVDGAEEQLGDAALLVEPLDALEYAAMVRLLRAEPARRADLVARGAVRAQSWTTAQYAGAVFDLIDRRIAPVRALWP